MLFPCGPPGCTITKSSTINGDADIAHGRFSALLSVKIFFVQTTFPDFASSTTKCPSAPSEYPFPSCQVGVARGPGPPSDS